MKYELGRPFPEPNLITPHDSCIARIVGSSFDALCCISDPTAREVNTFRNAFMRMYIKVVDCIPFIAVAYLGSNWTWDISISIVSMSDMEAAQFLESGNVVSMFLIDRRTRILKAIRTIGLHPEAESAIKDACRAQLTRYSNQAEVLSAIQSILSTTSTDDIIRSGMCFEFKGR